MKHSHNTAAVCIALALAYVSLTNLAEACTCIPTTVRESVADADAVFLGSIVRIRSHPNPLAREFPVRVAVFHVTRVWKGDVRENIEVRVAGDAFCQSFPKKLMTVGNELLVYAKKGGGTPEYFTTICSRTASAKAATDLRELGEGRSPHHASAVTAQMQHTIASVRASKTVDERTAAAEHLASLTKKIHRKEMTEQTIADLVSLLDSPDDSVRFWVATALGNLGPSAKAAIPKLQELLPRADCLNGVITSASSIRYALKQMGVTPPPRPNCTPIAG